MARSVCGGSAERRQQGNNEALPDETQQQERKHEEPQANDHESDKLDGAFVLDGDQFFDAREIASVAPAVAYWGMELDKYTNRVYFFNHLAPAETQWTPPAALVDPRTQDVLLWDASAQWFYLYGLQSGESRWVDDEECSEMQLQVNNERDDSHKHQEELDDPTTNAFRQ